MGEELGKKNESERGRGRLKEREREQDVALSRTAPSPALPLAQYEQNRGTKLRKLLFFCMFHSHFLLETVGLVWMFFGLIAISSVCCLFLFCFFCNAYTFI